MKNLKTLQEKIEQEVIDDLADKLRDPKFMLKNMLYSDIAKTVKEYISNGNDPEKYTTSVIGITELNSGITGAVRVVMLDRMFQAYYETRVKEILQTLKES